MRLVPVALDGEKLTRKRPNDEEKLRLLERLEERKNIFSFQTEHEPPTSARSTEVGITTRHKSRRLSFGKRNLSSTSSHCSLLGEQLGEQLGEGHNGNGNRAEARKALSNLASALKPRRSRAESAPLPFDSGMRQYTQKAQGSQTPAMGTVSSRSIMSEGGYEMIRGSTIAVCPSTLYKFGKPSVASSFDDEVPFLENNTTFSRPEAEYARSSMSRMCASLELPLYAPRGMQYYIPPLPIEYIPTPLRSATTSPQLSSPMSFQRPFTFPTYHRGSNSPTTLNRSDSQISHAYTQPTTSMEADIRLAVESPAAYSIDCPPSYYATTNDGPRGLPITTSSDTKITPHQFCPDAYCIESHRYTPCTSTPRYAYPPKPSINRPGCGWLHGPSATLDEANEEDEEYLYLADVRTYAQTPAIMIPKPTWLQLL